MKLKGFSILEIIVSLVIASIVTSLGLYVLTNLKKAHFGYQHTQNRVLDAALFRNRWIKDLHQASIVIQEGNTLQFRGAQFIDYHFENNYLIRSQATQLDTFYTIKNFTINTFDDGNLVTDITINLSVNGSDVLIKEQKKYGPNVFINLEKNGY